MLDLARAALAKGAGDGPGHFGKGARAKVKRSKGVRDMSRFISKRRALLATAATSLALVAVAVAFYSTTGSGTGSGGTTAAGNANLVITGTANASTLVPGGSVAISNGNIHNGNPGSAKHGTVSATVDAAAPGCSDSYFTVTGITLAGTSDVIAAGGDRTFTATLNMADDTVSQ